jgi:hypothetical protein
MKGKQLTPGTTRRAGPSMMRATLIRARVQAVVVRRPMSLAAPATIPDLLCYRIKLFSPGLVCIPRRKLEAEAVPSVPREHMQVAMKNFLHGRLAIREKEIHPLALHATLTQRGGQAPSHPKHLRPLLLSQVRQIGGVTIRDDKQVAGVHRLNVHKGGARVIPIDEASFGLARQNLTKDATVLFSHWKST